MTHTAGAHTQQWCHGIHTHSIHTQVYDCTDSFGILFLASDRQRVSMYSFCIMPFVYATVYCLLIQPLIGCVHHPRFYNIVGASALSPIGFAAYVINTKAKDLCIACRM